MLTRTPPPSRPRTWRAKAAEPYSTPSTLTSTLARSAAGSASRSGAIGSSTPALFTHRSMRPKRSATAAPKCSTASASVTSTEAVRTSTPSGAGGAAGSVRAARPRRRPASAHRAASPAPSPRLAPVITATRPATPAGPSTVLVMSRFEQAVVAVLHSLGPGDVVTYGEVAAEAGFPGAARAVGHLLATSGDDLPWWRVVTASGRLVPGHEAEHARRLRAEGVPVDGASVRFA